MFSKQKGLTLVFRNDPLESLKVSSTFDSIQFVRDYLQRTIEQQLRNLMMDELPAIIHRLSLELWCPDQIKDTNTLKDDVDEQGVDPFESPPLDPVDASGNLLDVNAISELTLNGGGEMQTLFSQKNLLRLAALTDSHRTLSLFTPGIRDVVFRAWSGQSDRSETPSPPQATPSLSKTYSFPAATSTSYTYSDSGSISHGHLPSRPSLVSVHSASSGLALGSGHRSRPGRKRKNRVVNLRRAKSEFGSADATSEEPSETASMDVPLSEPLIAETIHEDADMEENQISDKDRFPIEKQSMFVEQIPTFSELYNKWPDSEKKAVSGFRDARERSETLARLHLFNSEKRAAHLNGASSSASEHAGSSETSSVILEQAWIAKMAGEIARRVYDEKRRQSRDWEESQHAPPPYEAAAN